MTVDIAMLSEAQRDAIARIIDPGTWHDRDAYVRLMTENGGCAASTVKEIADRKVRDSLATADQIIALLLKDNSDAG
jgi:N-acyl-D-aspartate/D-glutamate deacylase